MRLVFAIGFASIIGLAVAVGAGISASAENFGAGKDASSPTAAPAPPGRVGRISLVSGKVGFRGPGEKAWSDAEINDPVARGVSVRTDPQARAELRIGSDTIDLAGASEVAVADLREQVVEIAVRHGRIGLGIGRIGDGEKIEVDIARGGVWLLQPGQYDIADGDGDAPSRVAAFAGRARFFGGGSEVTADAGTAVLLGPGSPGAIGERAGARCLQPMVPRTGGRRKPPRRSLFRLAGDQRVGGARCRRQVEGRRRIWRGVGSRRVAAPIGRPIATAIGGGWHPGAGAGSTKRPGVSPLALRALGVCRAALGLGSGGYAAHPVWAPATVAFLGTPGVGLSFAEGTGPAVAWFPLAPGEVYWPSYTDDLDYIRKLNAPDIGDIGIIRIRADGEPPAAITNGDYANRIFASVVPRPVFVAGQAVAAALLQLPRERLRNAPALMGSPQIGPPAFAARPAPQPRRRYGCDHPRRSAGRDMPQHVCGRARPGPERCAPPSSARACISARSGCVRRPSAGAGLCRRVEAALYDRAAGGACRPGPAPRRNPKGRNPKESDQAMIDYRSDNTGRAAPEILEALVRANRDTALGYGGDQWTAALQQRFSELFETAVRVFPVATGTAANALVSGGARPLLGHRLLQRGGAHQHRRGQCRRVFRRRAQAGAGCRGARPGRCRARSPKPSPRSCRGSCIAGGRPRSA